MKLQERSWTCGAHVPRHPHRAASERGAVRAALPALADSSVPRLQVDTATFQTADGPRQYKMLVRLQPLSTLFHLLVSSLHPDQRDDM